MDECTHFNTENIKEMRNRFLQFLKDRNKRKFACNECQSTFMLHFCLICGESSCFKDKHFRNHYMISNHNFAINVNKQVIYCFNCNKYVNNTHFKDISTVTNTIDFEKQSKIERQSMYNHSSYILNIIPDKVYKKYPCTIYKGSINLGNTCYLNSLFTTLLYLQPFKDYFLNLMHLKTNCNVNECIICDIYDVYKEIYSKSGCINLSNIVYTLVKKNSEFIGSKQYDVHELYIKLLNFISEVDQKLSNIFNGINTIVYECENCREPVRLTEKFYNLCLTFDIDAQRMIDNFFDKENVDGYNCNFCNHIGRCNKRYIMASCPEVLVLQLKRFEYKDNKTVKMNNDLALNERIVIDDVSYKFHGTIVHDGSSTNGHYRAYIYIDGKYNCFNDEFITCVSSEEALNNVSYLTFYVKEHNK